MARHRSSIMLLALAVAGPLGRLRAQETTIRGFTDVDFTATDARGASSAFRLGQFDTFITSKLAARWSFLSEAVFEFDRDFVVDVERLIVTYKASERFEFAAGKHHTPFGYWNTAYHHGTLLQPSTDRPLMFKFEDDGGPLPVHSTGLMISGRNLSSLHLGYDVMVANGIGATPISDNNAAKSLTVALHSQVTSVFRVGASFYADRIGAGTPTLSGAGTLAAALTRRMYGGFVAYLGPAVEALVEYQRTTDRGGSTTGGSDLYYVHGGYHLNNFTAYAQYNALWFPATDPYFDTGNRRLGLVGARYDFASTTALKVEYRRLKTAGELWINEVRAQLAVGF